MQDFIAVDVILAKNGSFAVFYDDPRLDAARGLVLAGATLSARLPSGYLAPLGAIPTRLAHAMLEAKRGIFVRCIGSGNRGRDLSVKKA